MRDRDPAELATEAELLREAEHGDEASRAMLASEIGDLMRKLVQGELGERLADSFKAIALNARPDNVFEFLRVKRGHGPVSGLSTAVLFRVAEFPLTMSDQECFDELGGQEFEYFELQDGRRRSATLSRDRVKRVYDDAIRRMMRVERLGPRADERRAEMRKAIKLMREAWLIGQDEGEDLT